MAIGCAFPEVLAAAAAGADWAWSALYRDLAGPLYGYLRMRGVSDVDEQVSEVFVQLVRGIGRFRGDEAGFRSWAFMIAHHRLVDERRRRARRVVEVVDHSGAIDLPGGDVEDDAMSGLLDDDIRRLLERLPQGHRDVLLLRILGGLTIEETAAVLGRSRGATKALQRRAVDAVRRLLPVPEQEAVPLSSVATVTEAS